MRLIHGDCLEEMGNIEAGSVNMICCDPPYGTVQGFGSEKKISHGMQGRVNWDEKIPQAKMLAECNRMLQVNSALTLFSQDPYTAKLMTETHGNLPFSYRLVWLKDHFANSLIAKKAPVNYTEDICVFFKKYDTLNQHPLRNYAKKIMAFLKMTLKEINADLGHRRAEHFFYIDSTQFGLCTEAIYNELITKYNINRIEGFMTYAEIKTIDRRFSRRFSRRFNLPENAKYKSNVLEYKKDYMGLHPTQKPIALIEDLIKTYTNKGDTVLDFCMGSGTTIVAADNLNRNSIGIEKDKEYFDIAVERINKNRERLKDER